MPTSLSCSRAASPDGRRRAGAALALTAVLAMLAGCAAPAPDVAARAAPAAPKPPHEALALDDAVTAMTVAMLDQARLDQPGAERRALVIDPLIDRATGNEAVATRSMDARIKAVLHDRFPQVEPLPFDDASLAQQPLVLAGSITTVAGPGVIPPSTSGPATTYRIWASLADLKTGRIVAHETAWVRADSVDMTPTSFYRDSPTWAADPAMAAYLKVCASTPGQPIAPAYLDGLKAAAAVSGGVQAYESGHYGDALRYYQEAKSLPAANQLQVYNGMYLADQALGRKRAAAEAFGQLVDYGLDHGKLAVKLVFLPASTRFWPDPAISGSYPVWLREIATRTAAKDACLRIAGHTSPTGTAAANEALSAARARVVRRRLVQREAVLSGRTEAVGRGSSEVLVGTGRDDATDVLDRRVEFQPVACGTVVSASAEGVQHAGRPYE